MPPTAKFFVGPNNFRPGMATPIPYVEHVQNMGGSPEVTLLADASNSRRVIEVNYTDYPVFARYAVAFRCSRP